MQALTRSVRSTFGSHAGAVGPAEIHDEPGDQLQGGLDDLPRFDVPRRGQGRAGGDQKVVPGGQESKGRPRAAGGLRQAELSLASARRAVQGEDRVAVDHIHRVGQGDVVAADLAGSRLVQDVVVELAQVGKLPLPKEPAGIDVQGAEHVGAFDHQPARGDLRGRPVAVPRQHLVVGRPAVPEQPQRRPDQRVGRADAVGRVGILMGPLPGAGQAAGPDQEGSLARHRPDLDAHQSGRVGHPPEDFRRKRPECRTAVRVQGPRHVSQKETLLAKSRLPRVGNHHQLGEVRRQGISGGLTHVGHHPRAVEAGVVHPPSKGLDLPRVGIDHDHPPFPRRRQALGQPRGSQAEHQAIAVAVAGGLEHRWRRSRLPSGTYRTAERLFVVQVPSGRRDLLPRRRRKSGRPW